MASLTPVQVELVARAHLVSIGAESPKFKQRLQHIKTEEEFEKSLQNKPTVADYAKAQREHQEQSEKAALEAAQREIAEAEKIMGFSSG
jgi:hypothetical protein